MFLQDEEWFNETVINDFFTACENSYAKNSPMLNESTTELLNILNEADTATLKDNVKAYFSGVSSLFEEAKKNKNKALSKKGIDKFDKGVAILKYIVDILIATGGASAMLPVSIVSTLISYLNKLKGIIERNENYMYDPKMKSAMDKLTNIENKVSSKHKDIKEKIENLKNKFKL